LDDVSRRRCDYTTLSITYWRCGTPTKIITVDASSVLLASSRSRKKQLFSTHRKTDKRSQGAGRRLYVAVVEVGRVDLSTSETNK